MTEIALSSYTPPQDPPATLGKLIEALRILLLPDPLLSFLPTSLEYLSTFQRFAEVIYHQARAVRDADDRLCVKLENNGVPGAEWVEQGALSEGDRRKLDDMGEEFGGLHRHYSNEMLELSIQLRLYHTAALLASPVAVSQARGITSQYFPADVSRSAGGTISHRYMKSERYEDYKAMLRDNQDIVREWYGKTEAALASGSKRPTIASLMSSVETHWDPAYASRLAERAIKTVELVLSDVQTLQDMFPDVAEEIAEDHELGIRIHELDVLPQQEDELPVMSDVPFTAPEIHHQTATHAISKGRLSQASPRVAKRSRPSSSVAPDYTVPSGKMGSRVDKVDLKPFDDSKLRRTSSGKPHHPGSTQRESAINGSKQIPIER